MCNLVVIVAQAAQVFPAHYCALPLCCRRSVEQSLADLGCGQLDICLLHCKSGRGLVAAQQRQI